jgi:hypothetical protein
MLLHVCVINNESEFYLFIFYLYVMMNISSLGKKRAGFFFKYNSLHFSLYALCIKTRQ